MIISEVKIHLIRPNDGLIGFASVVIDGGLYVGSIGIYQKLDGGYRLTFPKKDGFDVLYPISQWASQVIEKAVFEKLEKLKHTG